MGVGDDWRAQKITYHVSRVCLTMKTSHKANFADPDSSTSIEEGIADSY